MPAFSPLLSVYQATTQAAMDGVDPSKDPTVQAKIADAQAAGFNAADINSYYQSGVTAPSRTSGGDGFLSSITNSIPLIENIASVVIPGAAPVIAGINAAQSIASGKPINLSTALNVATALTGTNIIPPEAATAVKTANQALAAANALKTGNVTGLINSVVQITGASSDVKAVMNGVNAATAIAKGDVAGALNALNNLTGSVDPKVANLATSVLKQIDPSISGNTSVPSLSATTPSLTSGAVTPTATPTQPTQQTQSQVSQSSQDSVGPNVIQSMQLASALGIPTSSIFKKPKYFGATAEEFDPQTGQVKFVNIDPSTLPPAGSSGTTDTPVANVTQTSENASTPSVDNIASSDVTFDDILNILRG